MISLEEMGELLDELAEELPQEFFADLNGGILLLPQVEMHPKSRADDLYVMGRYFRSSDMGNHIEIYYGSFERLYGHLSKDQLREQLRSTLRHEFRHHLEGLSGERGLEVEDEVYISEYLRSHKDV
ncbi:MAG: metallopeptidase family protein [Christensenella sp.]|uniref:metallopeptidase family protein n=1 Tax=Christensenella sp. TaxID=1935934 RepID=UPI002B216198|nr:metallopeptidase family protein [Christensenella sp.]MEA5003761.1 metallopeptidase family protein [Christensenella sp.]